MENTSSQHHMVKIGAIYAVPIILSILLILLLNISNPLQSGPAAILFVFVLIYMTLTTLTYALLHLVSSLLHMFGFHKFSVTKRTYYLASVVTLWPIFMLALNTLGRLEATEVLLVTLLVGLSCFYVSRRKSQESNT